MLTFTIVLGLDRMGLPVLFKEISADLGLSLVSIGTIWGMDPLAGIFVSLLGGLLADRFGVKRTLTVICILAGIFCALRGLSTNFASMAATMFLFGLMAAMTPTITSKTAVVWFSGKYLALANGLIAISAYIGGMIATMLSATVLSPLLGGWRNVLFLMGGPAVVMGFLWLFTGREPDKRESPNAQPTAVPFRQSLSKVVHLKEVWILGLIQAAFLGTQTALIGYLPLYLRNTGWEPAVADTAITVLNGATMIGTIPMVILSNRLRSQKGVLFFSMVSLTASLALQPFVKGNQVFILLIVGGFFRSGALALFMTLIFEVRGVGKTYGGTAVGLSQALAMIAGFAAPPLGNSLAGISPGMPFIFWSILAAASLPLFLLIRERARSKEEIQEVS